MIIFIYAFIYLLYQKYHFTSIGNLDRSFYSLKMNPSLMDYLYESLKKLVCIFEDMILHHRETWKWHDIVFFTSYLVFHRGFSIQ